MPRHDFQRMGGFAHGQVAFAALAIACCLRLIPGALGFIKHNNARFGRFIRMHHMMFQKAMDILQRRARCAFCFQKGRAALGCGVARQGFPQYRHQRHISGKEGRTSLSQGTKYQVEAAKRLARPGNAGDENDIAPAFHTRLRNHARNGIGGAGQVMRICARGTNIGHGITPIQKPRRFQHAWHRPIGGTRPDIRFSGYRWPRYRRLRARHNLPQHGAIGDHHRSHAMPE